MPPKLALSQVRVHAGHLSSSPGEQRSSPRRTRLQPYAPQLASFGRPEPAAPAGNRRVPGVNDGGRKLDLAQATSQTVEASVIAGGTSSVAPYAAARRDPGQARVRTLHVAPDPRSRP